MIAELKDAEKYLKVKGLPNPRIEAEYIFCHLLNCERIDLYTEDAELNQFQMQNLYEFIELRAKGEPLQYILGKASFYGFEFKTGKGVFIPRPETEILIDTVVKKLTTYNLQLTTNILDLCTGCGNIAISLTKMLPHYKMFASDISEKAIHTAYENALLNNVSSNIEFRCGDLFKPWEKESESFFDVITCNPPYIKTKELKDLPQDVKNEPKQALDGGKDGLRFYKTICKAALFYLKEKGCIFFEVGPDIANAVRQILSKDFYDVKIIKDYNGRERVAVAKNRKRRFQFQRGKCPPKRLENKLGDTFPFETGNVSTRDGYNFH